MLRQITKMGRPTRFNQVQADAFLGASTDNSPFGKVWYVDGTNGSDGNAGDAPDEAYATIGAAITAAVATRGDSVIIYPGTYTITSALSPKAQMTFRAAVINSQFPSVSIRGNIATLLNVDVDGTRWIGIEFRASGTTARRLVDISNTTAVNGVTFEDCVFHGADTETGSNLDGVDGMRVTGSAVVGLLVRRCVFRDLGGTQLGVGVNGIAYAKIEHNLFAIDTPSGVGIRMSNTAAYATGKGYIIRNNEFLGGSITSTQFVGIVLAGTEGVTGAGVIRTNFFGFCAAAAITQNVVSDGVIENYRGADGGGAIIDSE